MTKKAPPSFGEVADNHTILAQTSETNTETLKRVSRLMDNEYQKFQEETEIHISNLEYLRGLSVKYPFLTSSNSGIDPYAPRYNQEEINAFEERNRRDFQTSVGENILYLELIIQAHKEQGFDVSEEELMLNSFKEAVRKWVSYDISQRVPEYGSLRRRGGIMKTIFGMQELGLEVKHDDRLMEWDPEKYNSARKISGLDRGFDKRFSQIQRFLESYYGRPILLRYVGSIDPGNGHNLLSYGFQFLEEKK